MVQARPPQKGQKSGWFPKNIQKLRRCEKKVGAQRSLWTSWRAGARWQWIVHQDEAAAPRSAEIAWPPADAPLPQGCWWFQLIPKNIPWIKLGNGKSSINGLCSSATFDYWRLGARVKLDGMNAVWSSIPSWEFKHMDDRPPGKSGNTRTLESHLVAWCPKISGTYSAIVRPGGETQ